jgi:hypothetical protein
VPPLRDSPEVPELFRNRRFHKEKKKIMTDKKTKKTATKIVLPAQIEERKRLLVMVAGSVAAGFATSPSPSITTPAALATAALDVAEQILTQAGIVEASRGGGYGAAS